MSQNIGNANSLFPKIETFKLKSRADNELLLQIIKDRQLLETNYANGLSALVEKYKPQCNHRPNVEKLLDFTITLTKDHSQLAKFLTSTGNMFERHIKAEKMSISGLQSTLVTSVAPERFLLLQKADKSKENYLKLSAEHSVVSQRSYETTQDLNEVTQIYRNDIVELEKNRSLIFDGREAAKKTFDQYESESLAKFQGFYRAFAKSIETMAKNKLKAADSFNQLCQSLKEYRFDEVHFENFWPVPPNVYFEHFESGSPLKDLIFGVPLSFTFRDLPAVLPPFLKNSIDEINRRGLNVEGLYRVSAKNSDRDKARIELETDLNAFHWSGADIHLLTGLVKAYLRELPEPLFPFPRTDRDAYSAITNETIRMKNLSDLFRTLPKNNLIALRFLLEHLNNVNAHSDKNKMGIENISLIFSALLFEKQNFGKSPTGEKDKEKEKGSHSWFKMVKSSISEKLEKSEKSESSLANDRQNQSGSNSNIGAPSTEMVADSFKNDMVLNDMMRQIDTLFPLEVKKPSLAISASSTASLSASLITQDPSYLNDTSSEKNFSLYSSNSGDSPSKDTIPKRNPSSISNLMDNFLKDGFDGSITLRNPPLPAANSNSYTSPIVGSMGQMGPLESPGKKVSMVHTGPLTSMGQTESLGHIGSLGSTGQMGSMGHMGPMGSSVSIVSLAHAGPLVSTKQTGSMGQLGSMGKVESPEPRRSAPVSKRVSNSPLSNGLRTDIKKDRSHCSSFVSLKTSSSESPPILVNDIDLNSSPEQTSNF